jgi:hypothetical protein
VVGAQEEDADKDLNFFRALKDLKKSWVFLWVCPGLTWMLCIFTTDSINRIVHILAFLSCLQWRVNSSSSRSWCLVWEILVVTDSRKPGEEDWISSCNCELTTLPQVVLCSTLCTIERSHRQSEKLMSTGTGWLFLGNSKVWLDTKKRSV